MKVAEKTTAKARMPFMVKMRRRRRRVSQKWATATRTTGETAGGERRRSPQVQVLFLFLPS